MLFTQLPQINHVSVEGREGKFFTLLEDLTIESGGKQILEKIM